MNSDCIILHKDARIKITPHNTEYYTFISKVLIPFENRITAHGYLYSLAVLDYSQCVIDLYIVFQTKVLKANK